MKTDDPRLEKSRKEMIERIEKMSALTLAVLRSHLLAEQCMADYIIASGTKPKWLRKATFFDKMNRCKIFAKDEGGDRLWEVLNDANQLRNTIAHTVSSEKIAERMKQLKERYLERSHERYPPLIPPRQAKAPDRAVLSDLRGLSEGLALPRGLRQLSQFKHLAKSGTPNHPMESLCFLPRVSHYFPI